MFFTINIQTLRRFIFRSADLSEFDLAVKESHDRVLQQRISCRDGEQERTEEEQSRIKAAVTSLRAHSPSFTFIVLFTARKWKSFRKTFQRNKSSCTPARGTERSHCHLEDNTISLHSSVPTQKSSRGRVIYVYCILEKWDCDP